MRNDERRETAWIAAMVLIALLITYLKLTGDLP